MAISPDHTDSYPDLESTKFLKSLIERSDSIISYFTPIFDRGQITDFKLQYITRNFSKYLDTNIDTLIHQRASQIFPIIFENGVFEIYSACYSKEDFEIVYEREFEFSGQKVWFQNKAIKQNDGIVVTSKDITQLKKTEEKLRDSLGHLEFQNTILNDSEHISKTASFRWNINKNHWYFSENMDKLFQETPEPTIFKKEGIFYLLNKQQREELKSKIDQLKYEDVLPPFKFSIRQNNKTYYFSLTANFVPSKDGQMMLGVVRDITDVITSQKLLEQKNEELLKINTELDSFNHIASHDLQEPLRKIRMFISRIKGIDQKTIPEKVFEYLEKINLSAERMQELILHLLTYSRIGKKQLPFEKVDLNNILNESLSEFEELIRNENVKIHADHLPTIQGIPFLIKQLFVNLISNGIKYKKDNVPAELWIYSEPVASKTKKSTDQSIIVFKDNGIGFDPIHKDSIFKLFHRLHEKTQYQGTGIGLAICKKIMENHHGSISVNSEKGVGSEFKIHFPVTTFIDRSS